MSKRADAGRAADAIRKPARNRLARVLPKSPTMGEVRSERMCQANLAIREFGKIAIGKGGRGEIREQPVIDVGAHRLNRVESQRRTAIYVGVEHPDARIEPRREQGYGHLRFRIAYR